MAGNRKIEKGIDTYWARVQKTSTRNLKQYEIDELYDAFCESNQKHISRDLFISIAAKSEVPTVCLQNVIRKRDGSLVADHIWVDALPFDVYSKIPMTVIEFQAEPEVYSKGYIIQTTYQKSLKILGNVAIVKNTKAYANALDTVMRSTITQKIEKFLKEEIKDGRFIG